MGRQILNVNTNATIILTAKLERLNKQAFPSAVRSTLNDAAFAMKQGNILESAKKNMTVRNPSFFRKFTGVDRAKGFDVKSMHSQVGFINTDPNKKKGQKAIEGMEHNEVGGSDNTGAMYMKAARTGGSPDRLVRKKARFDKNNVAGSKSRQKKNFFKNAFASVKENKPVFVETKKGTILVQYKSLKKYKRGNKSKGIVKNSFKFNSTILMRSRRLNAANAKATHFNKEAALKTQKEIEVFYAKNAQHQFDKVLRGTR